MCLCYIVSHLRWSSRCFDNAKMFQNITFIDVKRAKYNVCGRCSTSNSDMLVIKRILFYSSESLSFKNKRASVSKWQQLKINKWFSTNKKKLNSSTVLVHATKLNYKFTITARRLSQNISFDTCELRVFPCRRYANNVYASHDLLFFVRESFWFNHVRAVGSLNRVVYFIGQQACYALGR